MKIKIIHFFGVIINLFLVVMTIIRCCSKKKFYLGFLIMRFEKNFSYNNFWIFLVIFFNQENILRWRYYIYLLLFFLSI